MATTYIETTKHKYMKKVIMIIAVTLLFASEVFSQQVSISMDTVKSYRNDSVVMPVYVTNFTNIGAITIYLHFDTTRLDWGRTLSWHTNLNGNIPLVHQTKGTIGISWIDVAGVSIPDGLLFEIKFMHKQGDATISAGTATEFANPNGIIINHTSSNGLIWEGLTLNPDTSQYTICLGSSVQLSPKPQGGYGTLAYSWSSSDVGFSSTQPTITVSPQVSTTYTVSVTDGINTEITGFVVDIFPNISPAAPMNMLPADSSLGLFTPVTFSWTPSLHATHYDFYLWQATSNVPSTPTKGNLTQINHTYTTSFAPNTWYKWKVVAKNSCYATASIEQNFQSRALPNLNVTAVSTSQPVAGQPLSVTWTVTNTGAGPTTTPQWTDRIWIAPDFDLRIGEPDDILLGQFQNISALNPGDSYINTQTVMMPQNLMGPYFLFVLTDMIDAYFFNNPVPQIPYNPPPFLNASGQHGSGVVQETNSLDNFFYVQLIFPVPPVADLVTTELITPSAVFSGQQTSISYTATNHGTSITPAGVSWQDKVWLSPDSVFSLTSAIHLATITKNTPLHSDSTYTDTVVVNIPPNIYGNYYIIIQNDATNQVFENLGEDNNIRVSEPISIILMPPADLMVAFANAPDSVSIRQSTPVNWTVINQGGAATPATGHFDAVYISSIDTFNQSSAILLGKEKFNGSLPIGGSYTKSSNFIIPENIQGNYYFYIKTDNDNHVFEHTQKDNNIKIADNPTVVLRPDYAPVNIVIPSVDSTGNPIPINWSIQNLGPGSHVSGKPIPNRIYISSSPVWIQDSMVSLGDKASAQVALLPGNMLNKTASFAIPDGTPGPFYIYVNIDHANTLYETNINNNIVRSSSPIIIERPDLIVPNITAPASLISGDSAIINWQVKNEGNGSLTNRSWKDKIFMSRLSVFNPDSAVAIGEYTHSGATLNPGHTLSVSKKYLIPHTYQGTWYFYVTTDFQNQIYEKHAEFNNTSAASNLTSITLGPWADLEVMSTSIKDTATQGDLVPLSFTIKNTGSKTASASNGWKDKVYLSTSPVWNSSNLTLISTQSYTSSLNVDSSYTVQVPVTIPMTTPEGFYYLYIFTDAENVIYEYMDEANNIKRSDPIYILPYPPIDLAVTAVTSPTTGNSGNQISVGWTVNHLGVGKTLAAHWYDGIYLSQDPVFSPGTDIYLGEKQRNGPLLPGQSYSTTSTVTIPNGLSGTWYLIVVADRMDIHHDINRNNNAGTPQPIAITLTPSPDLIISDFSIPVSGTSGQPVKIVWEVSNVGAGPTLSGGWVDRFYISSDYVIDNNDKILGSKAFSGTLAVGQSYKDSAEFFIPSLPSGNYILIIKTDNNNAEYEHNAEHNNTVAGMLFITQPPPADLHITNISFPDSAVVGDLITIDWSVKNSGVNKASGIMKDNIFLSADTVWSVTDLLIGSVSNNINIFPATELARSLTFKVPGLTPGNYYLIAKTDVSNNIFETNENNNTTVSLYTIYIDLPELPIEVLLNDTLRNLEEKHYRIIIPDSLIGESMITYLTGDSAYGTNELYMTNNSISSRMNHDYSHLNPFLANQEVLVPSLDSGSYYLLAYGYTNAALFQEMTLFADILEFEIRNIHNNKGGNNGTATILMNGSKFDSAMTVFLDSSGIIIPASALYYIDMTKVLVSFNLDGAYKGLYDLAAINASGDTARLEESYRIMDGESAQLGISILHAANTRPNRISAFTIEFGNLGNTDIISPVIRVESLGGAPISLDTDGLSQNITELLIPLSIPGEPANILRPGVSGSIVVYTKSTTGLGILVTRL